MKNERKTWKNGILGLASVLACLSILVAATSSLFLKDLEINTWKRQIGDMNSILVGQTNEMLATAQLVADRIAERIETSAHDRRTTDFVLAFDGHETHQTLKDMIEGHPFMEVALVADKDGNILNYSRGWPMPPTNIADRDYFLERKNNSQPSKHVSTTIKGRANGAWVFFLSKRLEDMHGNFAGVVAVGISVKGLTEHYKHIADNLGRETAITLYRDDFTALSRHPYDENSIGKINKSGLTYKTISLEGKNEDVILVDSPRMFDNDRVVRRLGAVKRSDAFPVIMSMVVTEDIVLSAWKRTTLIIAAFTTTFVIGLMVGAYFLIRALEAKDETIRTLNGLSKQLPGWLIKVRSEGKKKRELLFSNRGKPEEWDDDGGVPFRNIHDDDRDRVRQSLRDARDTSTTWHHEYRVVLPDGMIEWRAGDASPLKNDDGTTIWHGYITDITERKNVEIELELHRKHLERLVEERTKALIKTEAHAQNLLKCSGDGLYGMDRNGTITFINPAACSMLGFSETECIGKNAHLLFHYLRTDGTPYPIEDCPGFKAVTEGVGLRVDDETYWRSDGTPMPVMYSIHSVTEDEEITGAVINFVDMSRHRAADEAKEKALKAAENLAKAKSDFLANMSHEIRTPLHGILGFARIGERNSGNQGKAKNAFEKIAISGNHLQSVIDEILDFSKIEAGKMKIESENVDLHEMLTHIVETVREKAESKNLDIFISEDRECPKTCTSDPLRLNQILLNLVSNAVKFTERGSVSIEMAKIDGRIVFVITDTGIGMTGEQLECLFQPFQQADGSTTRRFGGTGLGLAISRRLSGLLGGDIAVTSESGKGSVFTLSIPFGQNDGQERKRTPKRRMGKALEGVRMLLVDDEPINLEILHENMSIEGAVVETCENGSMAVERIEYDIENGKNSFDVILMDVQMPVMDGLEATRRILSINPGIPIIGQSAHASIDDMRKSRTAGMKAHITKPIDMDDMIDAILRIVRKN